MSNNASKNLFFDQDTDYFSKAVLFYAFWTKIDLPEQYGRIGKLKNV